MSTFMFMSRYVTDSIHDRKADLADQNAHDRLNAVLWKYGNPEVSKVRIVLSTDGRQLRTQMTGRKSIKTMAFQSKRYRCARYWEGSTEIGRGENEEAEVQYVASVAQSCRVEAYFNGVLAQHIPDFANLYADGRRTLGDAKRDWSDFRKPRGVKQMLLGEVAAAILGYGYETITLASLGSQTRRENIRTINGYRFTTVQDDIVARATIALSQGPMSLGLLSEILDPVSGRAIACALMVRRVLEIDLDTKLSERSECRAVPPLPQNLPGLFK